VYIDDLITADAVIEVWRNKLPLSRTVPEKSISPDVYKGKKVLSLIAHNGKKPDMCLLVVEYADVISQFDYIICTGTTGGLIKKFLSATLQHFSSKFSPASSSHSSASICDRIIQYQSGPLGGDVQIADIVLRGYCSDVIFLIDPLTPQPHEPDIKFMEELLQSTPARVITNTESAKYLLSGYRLKMSKL